VNIKARETQQRSADTNKMNGIEENEDTEDLRELKRLRKEVKDLKKDNEKKGREIEIIDKQIENILLMRLNESKKRKENEKRIEELKANTKMPKKDVFMKNEENNIEEEMKLRNTLPKCVNQNWDITCLLQGNTVESCNYIIDEYEEKYAGREQDDVELDDEDVTRARVNGRYFTDMERVVVWSHGNTASLPTYGLCGLCLDAGPVGLLCQRCPNEELDKSYKCIYTYKGAGTRNDRSNMIHRWIDCEYIADVLGTEVVKAKANRKITWYKSPTAAMSQYTLVRRLRMQLETRVITAEELMKKQKQIEDLWEINDRDDETELPSSQDNRSVLDEKKRI
jgi:hypothetical protein